MDFKIGQLVEIVDAPDQPSWIRDYTGHVALIVDKCNYRITLETTYLNYRYKVLIEEKVYEVHPLDLKPLNHDDP